MSFDCTNTCHFELIGHKSHGFIASTCHFEKSIENQSTCATDVSCD